MALGQIIVHGRCGGGNTEISNSKMKSLNRDTQLNEGQVYEPGASIIKGVGNCFVCLKPAV